MKEHRLHLVLVEPRIPQNTGNIARTCAAIGASLHLVRPMAFEVDDKKLKRAGLDYWSLLDIHYYESLADFIEKCPGPFVCFSTKAETVYSDYDYPEEVYLLFGREDAGLPESLLREHYKNCVRIPMIDEARSLNLSNAAAVGAYEVLRQWGFPALRDKGWLKMPENP